MIKYLKENNIRISRLIFYLLVFSIPFQTDKVILTNLSFIGNYHVFYNTIKIYLTDIVFFSLMLVWLIELWLEKDGFHRLLTNLSREIRYRLVFGFWLILVISMILSREIWLGLFGMVKITEFLLLFIYISENINLSRERIEYYGSNKSYLSYMTNRTNTANKILSREISRVFWLILASSWIQAGIGIYQYIFQRSMGLRVLGEEFIRPGLSGIAEFFSREIINPLFYNFFPYLSPVSDEILVNIRAYGTFSHPNVLAGFLFMTLIINLYLISPACPVGRRERSDFSSEKPRKMVYIILIISLVLISTGIVVTFSRFTWLISAIAVIIWLILAIFHNLSRETSQNKESDKSNLSYFIEMIKKFFSPAVAVGRRETWIFAIVASLLVSIALNLFLFSQPIFDRTFGVQNNNHVAQYYEESESFSQRQLFNNIAFAMISANPILGVGPRNFVSEMANYLPSPRTLELGKQEKLPPHQHQPVHNIYLLIAAESGVLAVIIFVLILYNIVRPILRQGFGGEASSEQKNNPLLRSTLLIILFGFMLIGMVDHYLWTIQQGALMFWLILGLVSVLTLEKES